MLNETLLNPTVIAASNASVEAPLTSYASDSRLYRLPNGRILVAYMHYNDHSGGKLGCEPQVYTAVPTILFIRGLNLSRLHNFRGLDRGTLQSEVYWLK